MWAELKLPIGHVTNGVHTTFWMGTPMQDLLDRSAPEVDIVMEVRSFGAVKGLVRAGIGLALLSASSVTADIAHGRLVRVPWDGLPAPRQVHLVHGGVERLSPAARGLRQALLQAY